MITLDKTLTASQILVLMDVRFRKHSTGSKLRKWKDVADMKMTPGEKARDFGMRLHREAHMMAQSGEIVSETQQLAILARAISSRHPAIWAAMMTNVDMSFADCLKLLTEVEENQPERPAVQAVAVGSTTCNYCKKLGHLEKDCRKKIKEGKDKKPKDKKRKNQDSSKARGGQQFPGSDEYTGCDKCGSKDHYAKSCKLTDTASEFAKKKPKIAMILVARLDNKADVVYIDSCIAAPIFIVNNRMFLEDAQVAEGEAYSTAKSGGDMLVVTHTGIIGGWTNVKVIPDCVSNLMASSCLTEIGLWLAVKRDIAQILDEQDKVLAVGKIINHMPCFALRDVKGLHSSMTYHVAAMQSVNTKEMMDVMHQRFGHVSNRRLIEAHRNQLVTGMGLTRACLGKRVRLEKCRECELAKAKRTSYRGQGEKMIRRGWVHVDSKSWPAMPGRQGNVVVNFFVLEECSFVFLWKSPSREKEHIRDGIKALAVILKAAGIQWVHLHSDGAPEYSEETMVKPLLESMGVSTTMTTAESPEQNGIAEAAVQSGVSMALTQLAGSDLPRDFWEFSLETAAYIRNRLPQTTLKGWMTPYEYMTGRVPDVGHIRRWGCRAYVLKTRARRQEDWADKAEEGRLIGYPADGPGYIVYIPARDTSVCSNDVKCDDETRLMRSGGYEDLVQLEAEVLPGFKNVADFEYLVGTVHVDDEDGLMYETVKVFATPKKAGGRGNEIVIQRKRVFDLIRGNKGPLIKTRFHVEDIARLTNDYRRFVEENVGLGGGEQVVAAVVAPLRDDDASDLDPPAGRDRGVRLGEDQSGGGGYRATDSYVFALRDRGTGVILTTSQDPDLRDIEAASGNADIEVSVLSDWPPNASVFTLTQLEEQRHERLREEETELIRRGLQSVVTPPAWVEYRERVADGSVGAIAADVYKESREVEIRALEKRGVFQEVEMPKNTHIYRCMWIDKTRPETPANLGKTRHKSRLVVLGNTAHLDKQAIKEVFSPVVRTLTISIFFCMAQIFKWRVGQMDVDNAFAYTPSPKPIYMHSWPGRRLKPNRCLLLLQLLYGLAPASRWWWKLLSEFLIALGFTPSIFDSCLFWQRSKQTGLTVILFYVDDILIGSDDMQYQIYVQREFEKRFDMKMLGQVKYFLGTEYNLGSLGYSKNQNEYCRQVVEKFKPWITLKMEPKTPLPSDAAACYSCIAGMQTPDFPVFQVIGSLLWLACQTRYDIAHAVAFAARFAKRPTKALQKTLVHILRYLECNPALVIHMEGSILSLSGESDSDYIADLAQRMSTSGGVLFCCRSLAYWHTKLMRTIMASTVEAEFCSAYYTIQVIVFITNLLKELKCSKLLPGPVPLRMDATGAIALLQNTRFSSKTKHVDKAFRWAQQHIYGFGKFETVRLIYTKTDDLNADFFTKNLPAAPFMRAMRSFSQGVPMSDPEFRGDQITINAIHQERSARRQDIIDHDTSEFQTFPMYQSRRMTTRRREDLAAMHEEEMENLDQRIEWEADLRDEVRQEQKDTPVAEAPSETVMSAYTIAMIRDEVERYDDHFQMYLEGRSGRRISKPTAQDQLDQTQRLTELRDYNQTTMDRRQYLKKRRNEGHVGF